MGDRSQCYKIDRSQCYKIDRSECHKFEQVLSIVLPPPNDTPTYHDSGNPWTLKGLPIQLKENSIRNTPCSGEILNLSVLYLDL